MKGFPVIAAERYIGSRRMPVDNATELLALRIHDPYSPCAAAIHVAGYVHFHAIGHAGFRAAQVGKDPVAPLRDDAVGEQVEGPDVPAPEVVDVEHAFIRRESEPVGKDIMM